MDGQRYRFFTAFFCMFILAVCLPACSKETRRGIDGYLYTAEELPLAEGAYFQARGGYLYYRIQGSSDSLYRISEERLAAYGETAVLESELVAGGGSGNRILGYTVNEGGEVYYYQAETELSASWQQEMKGGVLVKLSGEGEEIYRKSLEADLSTGLSGSTVSMAADNEGLVYLLAGNTIYVADGEGTLIWRMDAGEYGSDSGDKSEQLAEGEEGKIYYVRKDTSLGEPAVYEIKKENAGSGMNFRLERLTVFREEMRNGGSYGKIFGSFNGFLYNDNNGILKRYRLKDGSWKELLRWSDSNLTGNPAEVVWISEEYLAACFRMQEGPRVYLLTRKAAEEVPEKEELILAFTYSTPYLEQRIAEFNQENQRYHITPRAYAGKEQETRLDAEMVSGAPPDIMDLTYMDAGKYAEKGLLEDLAPYLESSAGLKKEEYWNGILEGYTVNDSLVCLPGSFGISTILGRESQVGSLKGWSMESVMALSEEYPEARLMEMDSFLYVLEELLGEYIPERYIDQESGVCAFDSGEFGELMLWLEEHTGRTDRISVQEDYDGGAVPENILLMKGDWLGWSDFLRSEMMYQGEMAAVGYPSREGRVLYYGRPCDLLGIAAGSGHKEGAWEFLEYYLSGVDGEESIGFPVRKDSFIRSLEEQTEPDYVRDEKGEIRMAWGEPVRKAKGSFVLEGEIIDYYCLTQEQAETLRYAAEHAVFTLDGGLKKEVLEIITEEMKAYLNREKTLKETTAVIQNRVQLLVQERR